MKIGLITARELPVFRTLLLPETVDLLEQDVPITALGLTQERLAIGALALLQALCPDCRMISAVMHRPLQQAAQ